ncbi:heme exporter protein CcmB [Candidatus Symbiobacter mobilis]|uniref:Heme exporter protein B n=1 Tax=Candidatus Symbiobacter mobilis CR TaxID=946483 RepID=U5N9M3_9BURK|nr:heme exporter protein CcmB [Candidatus Symbiobacter mobilis]AGX88015.1 heme exporter protein B [Candidatus Symbiobacter mobilis CR]
MRSLRIAGRIVGAVFVRELRLGALHPGESLWPLAFFLMVATLFAMGTVPALPRAATPGVVWVAALLATMMSLPRLYADDAAEGTLDRLLLSPAPPEGWVLAKVAAHCVWTGGPLVLATPVAALFFGWEPRTTALCALSLLLGVPTLSLVGSVGAALALGARNGGVLVALLVLPLYVPVLVFGAGLVGADAAAVRGHLSLLAALLAFSAFFAPVASAAALRIAME